MTSKDSNKTVISQNRNAPDWNAFPGIQGVFGGISSVVDGPMSWNGHNPEAVFSNRKKFLSFIGLEISRAVGADQVHGTRIHVVLERDAERGMDSAASRIPATDALITGLPELVLTTLHADCAPVYLYDARHPAIGLVHSGWRGTLAGLAGETVRRMRAEFGTDPADLHVAIGPTVSPDEYPVAAELAQRFADRYGDEVIEQNGPRVCVDLYRTICADLRRAGLHVEQLPERPPCTVRDARFTSYRRDGSPIRGMLAFLTLQRVN